VYRQSARGLIRVENASRSIKHDRFSRYITSPTILQLSLIGITQVSMLFEVLHPGLQKFGASAIPVMLANVAHSFQYLHMRCDSTRFAPTTGLVPSLVQRIKWSCKV
jgi:hypothetical protein